MEIRHDSKGREYFDGCIRDEKQGRHAYRYTLTQAIRHEITKDWRSYPRIHVNVELEVAIKRALEIDAFLEGSLSAVSIVGPPPAEASSPKPPRWRARSSGRGNRSKLKLPPLHLRPRITQRRRPIKHRFPRRRIDGIDEKVPRSFELKMFARLSIAK